MVHFEMPNTIREALEAALILQRQTASTLKKAGELASSDWIKGLASDCETIIEGIQVELDSMDRAERVSRLGRIH